LLLLWRDCGFATKWPVSRKMEYGYSGRDLKKKEIGGVWQTLLQNMRS